MPQTHGALVKGVCACPAIPDIIPYTVGALVHGCYERQSLFWGARAIKYGIGFTCHKLLNVGLMWISCSVTSTGEFNSALFSSRLQTIDVTCLYSESFGLWCVCILCSGGGVEIVWWLQLGWVGSRHSSSCAAVGQHVCTKATIL